MWQISGSRIALSAHVVVRSMGHWERTLVNLQSRLHDKFNIDHIYWLGDDQQGYRVATRWSLIGTHEGPSMYGKPTGKPIHIMGITHHRVQDGKYVREWTIFDQIALLKQMRA